MQLRGVIRMACDFCADASSVVIQLGAADPNPSQAVPMQHAEALEAVRHAVRNTFIQLGVADGFQLNEHILLRSDIYCGRRFLAEGLQAIWFVEEDQVKIHARDGAVARVLTVEEAARWITTEDRKVA
jgi:hypothetical protein